MFQVDLFRFPHLVDYRDDFVLGCMTGLGFSDFSKLMKDDLRGDMLYTTVSAGKNTGIETVVKSMNLTSINNLYNE